MSKRDLFILILKVYGLMVVVTTLFSSLPSNITYVMQNSPPYFWGFVLLSLSLTIGLFVLLIFYADKVVDLLKLDKGFDTDNIDLGNFKNSDIAKFASFLIGGMMIVDTLPSFLTRSFWVFEQLVNGVGNRDEDKFMFIANGLTIIVGYLLITNYTVIPKLLKLDKKEEG